MLLGTVISSDKTNILVIMGNQVAHPVLISLANLLMNFKSKASNQAFMLLALLLVPKFIEKSREI